MMIMMMMMMMMMMMIVIVIIIRKAIATARLTELCALKTINDTAKMALKRRKHTTKMQKTVTVKNSEGKMLKSTDGKMCHTCVADERRLVVDC